MKIMKQKVKKMINWISENTAAIVSIFGGSSLLIMASSIIKSFSQRKLNKAFDLFNMNTMTQKLNIEKYTNEINNITKKLDSEVSHLMDFIIVLTNKIDELKDNIGDNILKELDNELKHLSTITQEIELKDNLITNLNREIKQINIKLQKIENYYEQRL